MRKKFYLYKIKISVLIKLFLSDKHFLFKAGRRLCNLDGLHHANSEIYGSYKASCLGESSM